eukprot:6190960-Pleurochrysis_carterae.AAC.3
MQTFGNRGERHNQKNGPIEVEGDAGISLHTISKHIKQQLPQRALVYTHACLIFKHRNILPPERQDVKKTNNCTRRS